MTTSFDLLNQEFASNLFKGNLVYYADSHAVETKRTHLLQLTQVSSVSGDSVFLDNGRKVSISDNTEVCRGNGGRIYVYSTMSEALVKEAQSKLSVVTDLKAIDFNSLSLQQLSMIRDVARGAFTQVTAPSPCSGGCRDTVQVAGIDIDISDIQPEEVSATIAFNDASYELSSSDSDDIEDANEDDEYDDTEQD